MFWELLAWVVGSVVGVGFLIWAWNALTAQGPGGAWPFGGSL